MPMPRAAVVLATALLGLAAVPTATAQLATTIDADAPDQNQPIVLAQTVLAYLDVNRNGRLDLAEPDETVYLDLDGNPSVSYGDLRLTRYGTYAAGTTVDITNGDVGRQLATVNGWLGSSGPSWFADMDNNERVGPGDVRLTGATAGTKVAATDKDAGTTLSRAQTDVSAASRVGFVDRDADGMRDLMEPIIIDLDGGTSGRAGKVSFGDLRLAPSGPGVDAAPAATGAAQGATTVTRTEATTVQQGTTVVQGDEATPGWRTLDWMLIALGIANLVGLVVVYRLFQSAQPRNPFK